MDLVGAYKSGKTIKEIAEAFDLDVRTIRKLLVKNSLQIRTAKERSASRKIDRVPEAIEILAKEGVSAKRSDKENYVEWICKNGHVHNSSVYSLLKGSRCKRSENSGRKAEIVTPGTVIGDLICVEYLGAIDGHSSIKARNQTNGRELVITVNQFKGKKRLLLTPEECAKAQSERMKARKGIANSKNAKHTFDDLRDVCSKIGFQFLHDEVGLLYKTQEKYWNFKCHCGNVFQPHLKNVRQGITTSCGCVKSKPEKELNEFIQSLGFETSRDRVQINPFELDVYIATKNIAFEMCGLHWHSERIKGTVARTKHIEKLKLCQSKNIRLITIFEDEWVLNKEATKAYITAILGCKNQIIGARKTKVNWDKGREFVKRWHLQGAGRGSHVALEFNGEIVAVAVFAKADASRNSVKRGRYELIRYAVKPGISVPGGLGKLVKEFWLKTPEATELISYSDNRWSEGGIYKALNFTKVSDNAPSFWYFKHHTLKRYHRFTFRASVVKKMFPNETGTAWEILLRNDYNRIWDCGTITWKMERAIPIIAGSPLKTEQI
jgi:hypothetical protein